METKQLLLKRSYQSTSTCCRHQFLFESCIWI